MDDRPADDRIVLKPDDGGPDLLSDTDIRPWWQNPLNFIALGISMLLLGGGIGFYAGDSNASIPHNSVDEGFLQDMRYHHDQAVDMAFHYLTKTRDPHPRLLLLAQEILLSQQVESGRMIQLLRTFRASEANDTGFAMAWMGHSVPIDEMDGLASPEELDSFAAAAGDEAARIFAELMIDHHLGGIHMAEYAAQKASNAEVRMMAEAMIKGQQAEVDEMTSVLDSLG